MPCSITCMNKPPDWHPVDGVLLLDKDTGLSSNAALQRAKRLFGTKKAGHTGSLDPLASGLLPVCLGEATKLSGFLLNHDKRYQVRIRWGITTDTGDAEGKILTSSPVPQLTREQMQSVLQHFQGEILQKPPMYSALKHQGRRLYALARQGIEVERTPRPVTLHALNILSMGADELELDVRCSKGTYIRTLAEDLGQALGCGGHVTRLRRTGVGDLTLDQACTEAWLADVPAADRLKVLLPPDRIVEYLPAVVLSDETGFCVQHGQAVRVAESPMTGWVRLYVGQTRFLGMGEILTDGRVAPRRLLCSRSDESPGIPCFPLDGNSNGLKHRDG